MARAFRQKADLTEEEQKILRKCKKRRREIEVTNPRTGEKERHVTTVKIYKPLQDMKL